jgi:hypothetical protein
MLPKPTSHTASHTFNPCAPSRRAAGLIYLSASCLRRHWARLCVCGALPQGEAPSAFREQLDIAVGMQLQLFLFLHAWSTCVDFVAIGKRTARDCRRWARVISRGDERRDDAACGSGLGISVNGVSCRAEEQLETVKSFLLE